MADSTIVKPVGGKSAEEIAYELFRHVAAVEGKELKRSSYGGEHPADSVATRAYILDTYAECRRAVVGARSKNASMSRPSVGMEIIS